MRLQERQLAFSLIMILLLGQSGCRGSGSAGSWPSNEDVNWGEEISPDLLLADLDGRIDLVIPPVEQGDFVITPGIIDFGIVALGETALIEVTVRNVGTIDYHLEGFSLFGSPDLFMILEGVSYTPPPETPTDFDQYVVIAPDQAITLEVGLEPQQLEWIEGNFVLFHDGPLFGGWVSVPIIANQHEPCLAVSPGVLDFGGGRVGMVASKTLHITACGASPLVIQELTFSDGSSAAFSISTDTSPPLPSAAAPLVLESGEVYDVRVNYHPEELSGEDGDGNPISDTGELVIHSDWYFGARTVLLSGFGKALECPVAVIDCTEGDEVPPQAVLHLNGDASFVPGGILDGWSWSVEQPLGSQSVFIPSSEHKNPVFEVNVAGLYTFLLDVSDSQGMSSCETAVFTVAVIPDEAIHIEVLWHTPGDPLETDVGPEAGADLDLHFQHPTAGGPDVDGDGEPDGWYDQPFDCFWFNAHPEWGSFDPSVDDNPGLDRDDTDGAGPENINLNIPEDVTYKVGIDYWNDHGFGDSFATARVYFYDELMFEESDVLLHVGDMWEVCTIDWAEQAVELIVDDSGAHKITSDYENPFFTQD